MIFTKLNIKYCFDIKWGCAIQRMYSLPQVPDETHLQKEDIWQHSATMKKR